MRVAVSGAVYGAYGWVGFEAELTDESSQSSYGQPVLQIHQPQELDGVYGPGDATKAIISPAKELPDGLGGTFWSKDQVLAHPFPVRLVSLHLRGAISEEGAEWLRHHCFSHDALMRFRPGHSTIQRLYGEEAARMDQIIHSG